MQFIDSHAHLYLEDFNEDIDQVMARARQNEVSAIYLPNIDEDTVHDMHALVAKAPDLFYPMLGLHPTSVKEDYKEVLDKLFSDNDLTPYVAIGEIGIDLYWDKTYRKEQAEAFSWQIELAKKNELPIVIHARDSFEEIFDVVDALNDDKLSGIFHCFTGGVEEARRIMNYGGFKMGIGGVATFKNSGLDKVLPEIPLEYLVLETDSPYLAPVPYRGKRNESAYIRLVAERVAAICNKELEEVASITSRNARQIFGA